MSRARRAHCHSLRVTVALDHPAQHFAGAFALLSQESGLDVEVVYWDTREGGHADASFGLDIEWDVDLTSTYPHWSPGRRSSAGRAARSIGHLLRRRPDVILCYGWSTPIARLAIAYAALRGVPLLYYGDSTWQHSTRPRLRRVRRAVLRYLFSRPGSGALSTGTFNREFYLVHGLTPDRVYQGVCQVDTAPFVDAAARRPGPGERKRTVNISFAGKFVERKAPAHLIEAATLLPDDPTWHVTMVGEGPLRGPLEQAVERAGLQDKVTFTGFMNTSQMPRMLAAADILVIPSTRDMRILVATEAMAAGAVIVVSSATAVWGAGDLVEHRKTGMVYPAGDIAALTETITTLLLDEELRARLSTAAQERALLHDSDDFARLAASALRNAYARPRWRASR